MRKLSSCFVLLFLVFAFCGCSLRSMYIIRNSSKDAAIIILTINGVNDSARAGDWEIAGAAEIVPLKSSNLSTAFTSKLTGVWDKNGTCQFEVPAGWSVDITSLFEWLIPDRNVLASFNGAAVEIKYAHSAFTFGNNMAEVQRIFELKSSFLSGPLAYYLDLE